MSPSATARSTAGGTQGHFDIEYESLMQDCSKESLKIPMESTHKHRK